MSMDERLLPDAGRDYLDKRHLTGPEYPTWKAGGNEGDEMYLPKWVTWTRIRHMVAPEPRFFAAPGVESRIPELDMVAGPALLWALGALFCLMYFLSGLLVLDINGARCLSTVTCDASGGNTTLDCTMTMKRVAFAETPDVLAIAVFFVPAAAGIFTFQFVIMRYVMLPIIAAVDPGDFELINCKVKYRKFLTFKTWFAGHTLLTFFSLLDSMTNAQFTARMVATRRLATCTMYDRIQDLFYEAWSTSLFRYPVQIFGKEYFQFWGVVLACYILQALVQPLIALYFTLPRPFSDHKWPAFDIIDDPEKAKKDAHYRTHADHGDIEEDFTSYSTAVMVLAEACRMEALSNAFITYENAKFERTIEHYHSNELRQNPSTYEQKRIHLLNDLIEQLSTACMRGIMRFVLRGFVQNALLVNLQVSLIAVDKDLRKDAGGGLDMFNAVTTGLTIIGMINDTPDMIGILWFAIKHYWRYPVPIRDLKANNRDLFRKKISVTLRLAAMVFGGVLYFIVSLFALGKLAMVFKCKHGLSNLHIIDDFPKLWPECVTPE